MAPQTNLSTPLLLNFENWPNIAISLTDPCDRRFERYRLISSPISEALRAELVRRVDQHNLTFLAADPRVSGSAIRSMWSG